MLLESNLITLKVEDRIFLAINAGAGGVAVTRDGERRGDERKTFKVESCG